MFLLKKGITVDTTNICIEFEKIAKDMVMISIDNDINDQMGVPSYWMQKGSGPNPPLEIGINTDTGIIKRIVLFVDAGCFEKSQLLSMYTTEGNALVDCSIFTKQNDYIKTEGNYYISLSGEKFICKFSKECSFKEAVINGDFEVYVDANEQIMGFAINNLTESALKTVKSLM